jgi:hypothetical protein
MCPNEFYDCTLVGIVSMRTSIRGCVTPHLPKRQNSVHDALNRQRKDWVYMTAIPVRLAVESLYHRGLMNGSCENLPHSQKRFK